MQQLQIDNVIGHGYPQIVLMQQLQQMLIMYSVTVTHMFFLMQQLQQTTM